MLYNQKGTITIFPMLEAYYNPNCLVNIVSLDLPQSINHIVFDSSKENAFQVLIDKKVSITFRVTVADYISIT